MFKLQKKEMKNAKHYNIKLTGLKKVKTFSG